MAAGPEVAGRNVVTLWKSVASALFYGVVSSLMTFCNKSLSSTFDFSYPLFLLWVQMFVTQVGLCVMHVGGLGGFQYPRITPRGLVLHMPVACLYVLNAALAISSLQGMSIPTYGVLKRAGPLFILGINWANERFARKKAHAHADNDIEAAKPGPASPSGSGPGSGIVAGVLIIVCGTLFAGANDLHLSAITLRMALMSNVTQALYVTMVESKHKTKDGGGFNYGKTDPTLGLLAHNSLLSIPLLGVVVLIAGWVDGGKSWGFMAPEQYTNELICIFVLATVLGCSLNYTMFVCIRFNSALTMSLVGHAKTAAQTVIGFFVFAQEVQATYAYVTGVVLNAVGAFLFSMAKYHESELKKRNAVMRELSFWRWCVAGLGVARRKSICQELAG